MECQEGEVRQVKKSASCAGSRQWECMFEKSRKSNCVSHKDVGECWRGTAEHAG